MKSFRMMIIGQTGCGMSWRLLNLGKFMREYKSGGDIDGAFLHHRGKPENLVSNSVQVKPLD